MQKGGSEVILSYYIKKTCNEIFQIANLLVYRKCNYSTLEVEMHRHKKHQDASPMISPNELLSTGHSNDKYSQAQAEDGALHQQEVMEYCDSEEKHPKRLNFSIDSIESGRDPKSSIRSVSVVKDEDPSSVTSSGCSPPLLSHIDSPRCGMRSHEEGKGDAVKNSENDVKPEPSSTKHVNDMDSIFKNNRFESTQSKTTSPKFESSGNESREGEF